MQTLDYILSLIGQYGYLIVFFGVMMESMGVPLPGETILLASGFLVQQGALDLGDAIAFGILGAVIGDQIGYWVGREGGRPFVLKWGRYVLITPERLGRAERFFTRHGGKAVFLARFVAGLRVFGALVAGISRMPWRTFFFYNALGGATWATAAVLVGYLVGGSLDLIEQWVGRASILLAILLALAIALYLGYHWVSTHPEQIRRVAERLSGGRLQAFLQSPLGLWLRRRFSPRRAYGLTLTVGLTLTALFSWAFGSIVQDLLALDPLVRVDNTILSFVHFHSEPYLTLVARIVELLFAPEVLVPLSVTVGTVLIVLAYRRGIYRGSLYGIVLITTVVGAETLAWLLKNLFHQPRPPASLQLVYEGGYTFPSSHATVIIAFGAAIWYLFSLRPRESWGGSWRAKARVGLAAVLLALLVGLDRVYLGVHYPSAVLAGWALGGVWASICLTAAEVFRRLYEGEEQASGKEHQELQS
jgi:membrane protein DedA with SNARE-associated domain/membrane-associated phospholipid phosphatase